MLTNILLSHKNHCMKKNLVFTLCSLLFTGMIWAQPVNPQSVLQNDPSVRVGVLDNGLTYYIKYNGKQEKRAEFYLFTDVGAIQETPEQDGLAHFLEHMCFNGTKNFPGKGILNYMESIGARFGENINAGTGVEQTSYMLNNIPVIREGIIDTSLLVLHDYAHFVTNDPEEIDKERPVIMEELRGGMNASRRMREAMFKVLYKDSKYANCNVIGTLDGLASFPYSALTDFYQTWYRPDLQAVIVVGDIDVDAVENKIKTIFADIPKPGTPNPKVIFPVPDNKEPLIAIVTDPEATSTSVGILYKSPAGLKEDNNLGMTYLAGMVKSMASRMLNQRLSEISRQENAPFLNAGVGFYDICKPLEVFTLDAGCKDGAGLIAFEAALKELERVDQFGFTDSELERVKTSMLRNMERRVEMAADRRNGEFVQGYIQHFSSNRPYMTPEYELELFKGYMPFISVAAINQFVKESIKEENVVITYNAPQRDGLTVPTEKDLLAVMTNVKRSKLTPYEDSVSDEPLVKVETLKGGKVVKEEKGMYDSQIWTLENGVTVIVKPTELRKDEVMMSAYKDGGRSIVATADLPSIDGNVFGMYASLSGVSNFTAVELGKKLTGKIASLSPTISQYEQGFSGSSSSKDIETMLQLLYLRMTAPRFVASEFAPAMAQLQAVVPNLKKQPSFVFQTAFMGMLYQNNPRREMISEGYLEKIDFKRTERVYKALLGTADGMRFVFVGDFQIDALKSLVEKYIGSLPVKGETPAWKDEGIYVIKGKKDFTMATEMEVPKTSIMQYYHGEIPYTIENIHVATALKQIMDLTYTERIREEEGGTYGVGVQVALSPRPIESFTMTVSFDTDMEKAAKLKDLAYSSFVEIAENGPTDEQMQKTIGNMLKRYQEQQIMNSYWYSCLLNFYKYNIDNYSNYEALVNKISKDDIRALAAKILKEGNFIDARLDPKPATEE
jgi:Predicted Zn-dependent peptidases